ncbi:MAG: biotin--[acetyl-CoA-carboxylase] ligase [Christensenellales bacterium]|jgi:BirA family biotin operon repressor/biotin-[acetyl-CoA-carboxylase] ligase
MREQILDMLIRNAQQYVSGQQMCEVFGVTRAAIWKHIKALQAQGYEIDASPKKGYRLLGLPDLVQPALVQRGMYTEVFGRTMVYKDTMESTNMTAKKLAAEGAEHGTLVLTEEQTQGKGRQSRTWFCPRSSGVMMSLILRPDIKTDPLPITLMAAVAVSHTLRALTFLETKIKWPNDIVIGSKKVCGILTEAVTGGSGDICVVVGIGVNVNMREEEIPPELSDTATSLYVERGLETSRLDVVRGICYDMELLYNAYVQSGDASDIIAQCREHSATIGQRVRVIDGDSEILGEATGIDDTGALIVATDAGERRILSGEISVRGIMGYV